MWPEHTACGVSNEHQAEWHEKKYEKTTLDFHTHMYDFSSLFFFFNVYSFLKDRERQSTSRGGVEREGDTESEAGSRL